MGTLLDPKTGKTSFDKDWLYLTVVSQNQGFRIKMVAKFKEDAHAHAGALHKEKNRQSQDSMAGEVDEEGNVKRKSRKDQELTIDNLELG